MEQKELPKLRSDKTIVIKPADKGGAVVIVSTGHYQSMIMQHLLDKNTYKKLDSCTDSKIQSNLFRFLRQFKMCFTKPESKFLHHKHHELSRFYGLLKIRKSKMIIESAINTQNSEIIEIFEPNNLKLRPIRDEETEIVTFDVVSSHTSISHEFGLETLEYFLSIYQEDLYPRFKKEFALKSANFIIKRNTLTLDSEFYL